VHWWPPFADFDVNYVSFLGAKRYWVNEKSGVSISQGYSDQITNLVEIAEVRQRETEEILGDKS
jgi:hypothetical protein